MSPDRKIEDLMTDEFPEKGIDADIAYFKKDGNEWNIYDATGGLIGQASTPMIAKILISQNDLTPVSLN